MPTPSQQAMVTAITAVQSIVGTLHLAAAQENDPDTLETLSTVLAVALTARNALEAVMDDGPGEPAPDILATMGQNDDSPVFTSMLRPDPAACEHEDVIRWSDPDGDTERQRDGMMCRACGEDPRDG